MKHQSKNKRRLFFAVWPDTKTLTALLDAQNSISAMKARPVPAENLHITLVFIGSASKETERCLVDAASELSAQACTVRLSRFGYFSRPELCWIGSETVPPELLKLRRDLCRKLRPCLPIRSDTFKPHVTLFRRAESCRMPTDCPVIEFPVNHFSLASSVTRPEGAKYYTVHKFPL